MDRAFNNLRIVQWAMLFSIVLYPVIASLVKPPARNLDPAVSYLFTTLGVAMVGAIFVVRRTLVFRAAASLTTQPDDVLSLSYWQTGYIVTYALCEALALFGMVQYFLGGSLRQSMPYFIGGLILLLFFSPRKPSTSTL